LRNQGWTGGRLLAIFRTPICSTRTDNSKQTESFIPGKDASLESSIATMQGKLDALGFHVEERSWLNPVDGVWSVHVRDRDCALLFTTARAPPAWPHWPARWASSSSASPAITSGLTTGSAKHLPPAASPITRANNVPARRKRRMA